MVFRTSDKQNKLCSIWRLFPVGMGRGDGPGSTYRSVNIASTLPPRHTSLALLWWRHGSNWQDGLACLTPILPLTPYKNPYSHTKRLREREFVCVVWRRPSCQLGPCRQFKYVRATGKVVARWWQHGNAPAVLKGRDNPTCLHVQVAGRLLV